MGMEIGIVGLPNVGKSTLFNALTRAGALVANYPFTTIDPNIGVVPVDDPRLTEIARIIGPEEVIPTTVRFVDIAGLVKGASRGEGLGNQFLGQIRNVDAVAMVVRCFTSPNVIHVSETLDPLGDIALLDTELLLADVETIERRLEKVRSAARAQPREHGAELVWLERLHTHVAGGQLARTFPHGEHEPGWVHEVNLLTARPRMFVLNIDEDEVPHGGDLAAVVRAHAAEEGVPAVAVCAQLEAGLTDWPPEEAATYRSELGVTESGLVRVVGAGYRLLDLVTFFTTTGGKIVQAWTVARGTHAPAAAGRIHTDMERGFIRAEVVHYDDLAALGSLGAAREHGLLRLEGRDYVIRDGDVVHFRFGR
jgi:ribosome-binding ATPase